MAELASMLGHESADRRQKTFEDLYRRRIREIAEVASEVDSLDLGHLDYVVSTLIREQLRDGQPIDEGFLVTGLATEILRFFMGQKWHEEVLFHVANQEKLSDRKIARFRRVDQEHFSYDADSSEELSLFGFRCVRLAELLLNMQSVPGMKDRVDALREKDLVSTICELECAKLVANPGSKFRFVVPVGVKGCDYDGEFETHEGKLVCTEFKSKSDRTPLTSKTVRSALDKARRQLPKGQPAIIFIRVPETWAAAKSFSVEMTSGIEPILRQSNRIVAVVVCWEERHKLNPVGVAAVVRFIWKFNRSSGLLSEDIEGAFDPERRKWNGQWVDLGRHVKGCQEDLTAWVRLTTPIFRAQI